MCDKCVCVCVCNVGLLGVKEMGEKDKGGILKGEIGTLKFSSGDHDLTPLWVYVLLFFNFFLENYVCRDLA